MFNLKKVFGIISFEANHIKILVVENASGIQHCLYFKKVAYPGHNENFKLNDHDVTKRILNIELLKVDKFIGTKVKRYLLDIPNLPINMIYQSFDNQNFKSEADICNYINNNPYYNGALCIKKQIINYKVNDRIVEQLPQSDQFTVNCLNCFINKNVISEYEKLFAELLIGEIGFYNNAFVLKNAFRKSSKSKLLIDIYEQCANLIEYGEDNEIVRLQTVDFGTDFIKKLMMSKILVDDEKTINKIIQSFKNIYGYQGNPTVINYYQNQYLKTKQLRLDDLKKICISLVIKQINQIASFLVDKKFDEIKLNCTGDFLTFYKFAYDLEYLKMNEQEISICDAEIIGLENENISHLIYAISSATEESNKLDNVELTSIDPFYSEDMSTNQLKQNIIIKIGILSTNISAKLGQGD